ncbi:DMT family transporter [Candidatus Woesebacteria bacterium]|nr:DMT family transporter [Candidatus Woesebacteria bacterium]
MIKKNNSGFWAIFASAMILGSYGLLARYLNDTFGYFSQVFFRGAVAFVVVGAILLMTRAKFTLSKKDVGRASILGLIFFGGVVLFTVGSILDKISVVMFMFYAGSFFTSFLISTYYYHEKVSTQKGISLAVVLIGLLVTTGFNFSALSLGLLAAFFSGALDSTANNLRKQLAALPKQQVLLVQFIVVSTAALLCLVFTKEIPIKNFTFSAIIAGITWGVLWVVGNRLIMIGYQHFDFLLAQIVLSSEIFFATLFALVLFHEMPSLFELTGGILIFVGVLLVDIDLTRYMNMIRHAKKDKIS